MSAPTGTSGRTDHDEQVDQARLREALNRYLVARTRPADDPERGAARAALVGLLQEAGWEPPEAVRRALLRDRPPGEPAA